MERLLIPKRWTPIKKLLALHAMAGEQLTEATATGNPATFTTTVAKPLLQCQVGFTPVQSGSGDPSPSNVRPISGWTGRNVVRCGKNLYKYDVNAVEVATTSTSTQRAIMHTGIHGGTLTFSGSVISQSSVTTSNINIGSMKNNIVTLLNSFILPNEVTTRTFTFSDDEEVVFMAASDETSAITLNLPKYNIQIELGSTATPYAPYTGNTYAVDWTDEAGTVYGGYVDPVRGVLVATQVKKAFSQFNWLVTVDSMFQVTVPDADKVRASAFCECFKKGSDYTEFMSNDNTFYKPDSAQFLLHASSYADKTALLAAVGDYGIVYTLATPIEYPLTPQVIKTLKGTNNVFSNTNDNITVKYLTKGA